MMNHSVRIGHPSALALAPAAQPFNVGSLLRLWPLMVAGLVMAGLLLSLAAVVRQTVRQAQAHHAGTAARADADFHCSTIASGEQRRDCRVRAAGLFADTAAARP